MSRTAAQHSPEYLIEPLARTVVLNLAGWRPHAATEETGGEWLQALVHHPQLTQRPKITADDGTTVVGREPESLARVLP